MLPVGFPNAGKSTLIAAISAARPKIADYPLRPDSESRRRALGIRPQLVVADIPVSLRGAEGKGLGYQFLVISNAPLLLHLIDVSEWAPDEPVVIFPDHAAGACRLRQG